MSGGIPASDPCPQVEVVRDDALPEPPGGDRPQADEHEQHDRSHRRAGVRQIASGSSVWGTYVCSGSGSGGGRSAGLACGYASVTTNQYACVWAR